MRRHHLIALNNAKEGRESEFNQWFDHEHLPEVLKVPGFVAARRFRLIPESPLGGGSNFAACAYRFLAIYEIEGDPAPALSALSEGINTGQIPLSDALDASSIAAWLFEPIDTDSSPSR